MTIVSPAKRQEPVRVAVVGAGRFGARHARAFARAPGAQLVAVVDVDHAAADALAQELGCEAVYDHRDLYGRIDAASIVVPASLHFALASDLANAGIDLLVEKPMTDAPATAEALVALAGERNLVLQVGHIERFSSCFRALEERMMRPLYFESNRIAPFAERNLDVDVIFDLMIHDIDIVIGLARSKVVDVNAVGTQLFSEKVDLANARLTFELGAVANITASRVSYKVVRNLRIFQPGCYLVCDFVAHRIFTYSVKGELGRIGVDAVAMETVEVPRGDSLASEIEAFLECVRTRSRPSVDGHAGHEAVEIAQEINDSIQGHLSRAAGLV